MFSSAQQQYLKVQVETASPGELTLLLYQELVRCLSKSKVCLKSGKLEEIQPLIYKAKDIFTELLVSLDMQYSLSQDLAELYQFYNNQLAIFLIKKDVTILEDVLEFCRGMHETWKKAIVLAKNGEVHENV